MYWGLCSLRPMDPSACRVPIKFDRKSTIWKQSCDCPFRWWSEPTFRDGLVFTIIYKVKISQESAHGLCPFPDALNIINSVLRLKLRCISPHPEIFIHPSNPNSDGVFACLIVHHPIGPMPVPLPLHWDRLKAILSLRHRSGRPCFGSGAQGRIT